MGEDGVVSAFSVFIAGPASWNSIVVLDRLPEPVPGESPIAASVKAFCAR